MHPSSNRESAPPAVVEAVNASDLPTPLSQLIHLLQGAQEPMVADVGITRCSPARLQELSSSAGQEADACLERAQLMLQLIEDALESEHPPEPGLLLRVIQQAGRSLFDHRRWRDLAENAAYYRDNAGVRERISSLL